jgi:hypothetical protein
MFSVHLIVTILIKFLTVYANSTGTIQLIQILIIKFSPIDFELNMGFDNAHVSIKTAINYYWRNSVKNTDSWRQG